MRQEVARPAGLQDTEALPARCSPAPRHVPAAAPRMRALARANYRVPGRRAVHPRPGQARTSRATPAAGSGPGLMFPRPKRPVASAQPLPSRARASRLAVGPQPDAQHSPCVSRGGPTAPGPSPPRAATLTTPTSGHPCPALPDPPTPEGTGRQQGWPPWGVGTRAGPTRAWEGRGGGQVQPPTAVTAVAAASPRDPNGRKRKCLPGARARCVSPRRWLAATCTSYGLLHRELEPAWGLCLLPVSRPALPPTVWLIPLARRLESLSEAGRARRGLYGAGVRPSPALPRRLPLNTQPPRAGPSPSPEKETEATVVVTQVAAQPN